MLLFAKFVVFAFVIVVSARFLAKFAHGLAHQTGLGTFITGLVLLAGATSLPEFSVGFSAVRMDAADLTAGDVLGSSLINLMILAFLDLVTRPRGQILSRRAAAHALSGTVACIMTSIVLLGLLVKSPWTFFFGERQVGP